MSGAYSRLDVKSGFHRKVLHLGNSAWGALQRLIAISNDYGTDGWVDETTVRMVCVGDELTALVSPFPWAGHNSPMLERDGSGWRIHDYLEHNDSAAIVARRRGANNKRAANAANARWGNESRVDAKPMLPSIAQASSEHAQTMLTPCSLGVGVYGSGSGSAEGEPEREPTAEPPEEPSQIRRATSPAAAPDSRAPGAAGFAAEGWVEGVRVTTGGRPSLAPWERRDIEDLARDRPADREPSEWGRAEGVAFATRQRGSVPRPQVTARNYLAWVGDGRPGPFDRRSKDGLPVVPERRAHTMSPAPRYEPESPPPRRRERALIPGPILVAPEPEPEEPRADIVGLLEAIGT